MRFDRIEIGAFGALGDVRLDGLGGRLSVIFGQNGTGKTTLLHFLRGVCCGFAPARRLGLVPAATGEPGGGAVGIHWQGQRLRLMRSAADGDEQPLKVTVVRELPHGPRFDPQHLPVDQIPLLYTIEHADVHTLDRLVQLARQAGIDVETPRQEVEPPTAAAHVATRERQRRDAHEERIAELTNNRDHIQRELEQLRAQLAERRQQLADEHRVEIATMRRRLWQRVNWLQAELQSAETDLREAEDAVWNRPHPFGDVQIPRAAAHVRPAPSAVERDCHARQHETHHRQELADIDGAMAQVRVQLAQIAQARLKVNLEAARIAGSFDLTTDTFLRKLRAAMRRMEHSLLELQDDADRIGRSTQREENLGEMWAATRRTAVDAVRRRLYRACDCVSQFELRHRKAKLRDESIRLDQEEQAQFDKLHALQRRRQELAQGTGQLLSWRGAAQHRLEQELCACAEHHSNELDDPPVHSQTAAAPVTGVAHEFVAATNDRAIEAELSQLRQRRCELAAALEAARQRLRDERTDRPPETTPEDIRKLERRIDRKRLERHALERELAELQSQSPAIAAERSAAGDVLGAAAEQAERISQPPCLRWAGTYLSRLTAGRYVDLRVTNDEPAVWIIDDAGQQRSPKTLSRGTLNLAALSLRLALVTAFAEHGVRFPLVLDDVLVDCDIERLGEAVRLLKEFAADHDQQIVYLTCGVHLLSLFEAAAAAVRFMPGTTQQALEPRRFSESPVQWSVHGWIDRQSRDRVRSFDTGREDRISRPRTAVGPPTIGMPSDDDPAAATEPGGPSLAQPLRRRQPGDPYWLSANSRVLLVPSIGEQMGRRLSALGIRTVADLLTLAADDSSMPLKTLQVEPVRFREWQAEALLLACVPDLTGPDAQVLVACDVHDPDALAASDVDQLLGRLERHARRHQHSPLSAAWPSRESIARWIQSARRSRSLATIGIPPRQGRRADDDGPGRDSRYAPPHRLESAQDPQGPSRPAGPAIPRGVEDEDPSATEEAARPLLSIAASRPAEGESGEPRFFLHAASPVEDAPSIGPKMASQLKRLKINTVGDLLVAQPAAVAARLRHRRVKEHTVAVWQQQARLMCRIPQLRGHDAQMLVACDITEPEHVARLDARTLYSIVGPFAATREGQRLLRSSKTPDLEEVADWIKWANQARPLRAA